MLEFRFRREGRLILRRKDLLGKLASLHVELEREARDFFRVAVPAEKEQFAREIPDLTIEAYGFFRWDSGADVVSTDLSNS